MVPIYLINLDRSPARLAFMQGQFDRLRISAERVPGIDGRNAVSDWLRPQFPQDTPLTSGEVGCYASHLKAMQRLLDGPDQAAVILEDDVILDDDFARVVDAAVAAAPQGWDVIHLAADGKQRPMVKLAKTGERWLVRHARAPINAAAYAVSRGGAKKILAPRSRTRPIDIEIRYAWLMRLDVLGVESIPARQRSGVPSTIDYPQWRSVVLPKKYYWAPSRLWRVYGWFYTQRKLGPIGALSCFGQGLSRSLRKRGVLPARQSAIGNS